MKLSLLRRRQAPRRGQALAELALILPLLVVLLVGLFELGMLLYAHVQVANAARESARALSLYRVTRFSTMANTSNPASCATGVEGWSLQQTAEQAIVSRGLSSSGCPSASGTILYSSLGWLNPSPSPAWTVTVTAAVGSDGMPAAASGGTVELRYPYRMPLLANMVSFVGDPVTIRKSVQFEFQP